MSRFELYQRNGLFEFRLVDDCTTVLQSGPYKLKQYAFNGIEAVKRNSKINKRFKRFVTMRSPIQHTFTLVAGNYMVICTGKKYPVESARNAAIEWVKENAATAEVDDLT